MNVSTLTKIKFSVGINKIKYKNAAGNNIPRSGEEL